MRKPQRTFCKTLLVSTIMTSINCSMANEQLEEIIVSGTKIPKPINHVTHSVSLVSEDTILQQGHTDLTEVLRNQAGIEFKQAGGVGQFNYLRMRGLTADNVLIVLDGIKINKPSSGNTGNLLSQIDPKIIESIEILRGPQAALYGANASAGIIVIKTKSGEKATGNVGLELGSMNWRKISASLRNNIKLNDGSFNYALNISDTDSDNTHKYEFFKDSSLQFKAEYKNDNYQVGFNYVNLDNTFGSAELKETYSKLKNRSEHWAYQLPDPNSFSETEVDIKSINFSHNINNSFSQHIKMGVANNSYSINDKDDGFLGTRTATVDGIVNGAKKGDLLYFYDKAYPSISLTPKSSSVGQASNDVKSDYKDKVTNVDYNIAYKSDIFDGLLGAELIKQKAVKSGTYGNGYNRDEYKSLYGNGSLKLADEFFIVSLGLRTDDYKSWGNKTSGNIGAAFNIDNNTSVFANYGTSFKPATLSQLFGTYGDSNLKPEKGKAYEAGIRHQSDTINIELSYWNTEIKDVIYYNSQLPNPNSFSGKGLYDNGKKFKSSGGQLTANYQLSNNINLKGNYTYTDAKIQRKVGGDFDRERQSAKHSANVALNYQNGGLHSGINLYYTGPRLRWNYDVEMKEYTRVDVSSRYTFDNGLGLSLRIENLLDEDIEEGLGYEEPGTYAVFGINYSFNY